jgi:hypothetical protein
MENTEEADHPRAGAAFIPINPRRPKTTAGDSRIREKRFLERSKYNGRRAMEGCIPPASNF